MVRDDKVLRISASTLADVNSTEGSYDITIAGGSDNNYNLQYTYPAGV